MKNLFMRTLVLLLSASVTQQAFAAYECNAKITNVLVYSDGSLNILHTGRGDYTVVCNLNAEWKGVSVTTCVTWFALLEAAKRRNGTVNFYYAGDGSCATLPTYGSAPAPGYIGDVQG